MNQRLLDLYSHVSVHATADLEHEAAVELLLLVMTSDHHISEAEIEERRLGDEPHRVVPRDAIAACGAIEQRVDRDHIDDPYGYCLPMGVPRTTVSAPFKILVTPGVTAMLAETAVGMVFRQVFTDGRPLPTKTFLPTNLQKGQQFLLSVLVASSAPELSAMEESEREDELTDWLDANSGAVEQDDPLVEIQTDKATVGFLLSVARSRYLDSWRRQRRLQRKLRLIRRELTQPVHVAVAHERLAPLVGPGPRPSRASRHRRRWPHHRREGRSRPHPPLRRPTP